MAYWIMRRAIERDPNSVWAKEATEQWFRYCEAEFRDSHGQQPHQSKNPALIPKDQGG
jgi:hypothetical protein